MKELFTVKDGRVLEENNSNTKPAQLDCFIKDSKQKPTQTLHICAKALVLEKQFSTSCSQCVLPRNTYMSKQVISRLRK